MSPNPIPPADSGVLRAQLQEAPLRALVAAGMAKAITAVGLKGHFIVEVSLGDGQAVLANARDQVRVFAALSSVAAFLSRIGCNHFSVDTSRFEPGLVRAPQPERSAAMKSGTLPKAARKSAKPNT
jgi:hypothetical protein